MSDFREYDAIDLMLAKQDAYSDGHRMGLLEGFLVGALVIIVVSALLFG